jgi:hypothetical protein
MGMSNGDANNFAVELTKEMIRGGKLVIWSSENDPMKQGEKQANQMIGIHAKLYEYFKSIDNSTPA